MSSRLETIDHLSHLMEEEFIWNELEADCWKSDYEQYEIEIFSSDKSVEYF